MLLKVFRTEVITREVIEKHNGNLSPDPSQNWATRQRGLPPAVELQPRMPASVLLG
jgi:hypothetical protein